MFSGGQTQNVQPTAQQQPITSPACLILPDADRGGAADMNDGIADGMDCSQRTLFEIKPLVCGSVLSEEDRTQCEQRLTDVYILNHDRVPNNLRPVFYGFVETTTNLFFRYCAGPESIPQSTAQCMFDSLKGEDKLINLWGSDLTYLDFFATLANFLSGQNCRVPTFTEIQAGKTGLICTQGIVRNPFGEDPETPAQETIPDGRGGVSPWTDTTNVPLPPQPPQTQDQAPCHIPTSFELAAMMTLQSVNEKHAYMNERHICHDEPQPEQASELGTEPQQNGRIIVNPWGGSNPWE